MSTQQNQQPFDIYSQQSNTAGESGAVKSTSPPDSRPTTQSPPRQSGPPTAGQSASGRHNPPPPKQQPPTQAPQSQAAPGQPASSTSAVTPSSSLPQGMPPQQQQQPTQQQSSSDYSPGPPSATKTTNKAPPTPTEIPLSAWRRGSSSSLRNSGSFSSASGMPPMAPSGRYQGDTNTGSTPPAKAAAPPVNRPPSTPPTSSSAPPSQTQLPPPSAPQQGTTQQTPQPAPQQGSPSPPPTQAQPPAQNSQPSSVAKPGQQPQVQPTQSTPAAQSTSGVQSQQTAHQPVPQEAVKPPPQQAAQPVPQHAAKAVTVPQPAPQQAAQPTAQPAGQTAQQQPHPVAPQTNSSAQPSKSVPPPTRPNVATTTQPPAASHQPPSTSSPHRSPSREMPTPNQTPVRNQPAENSYLQPSSPNGGGKRASIPWVTPSNDASRNDADNECTYVTMGSMAHHVIERLDEDNQTSSTTQQHYALVETSKMVDDMLIHRPEDLSKSGRCLHLHNPHHVTRRGEIVFAPTTGNTLESNTTPHTLTSWPIPPPTPGNYGRLQSIQGQITLVGCHRYEPDVMEELAYVDRAVSEGPNKRGYFSVERTNEALYGRTKNAYPDTGNLKYNASHFSPSRQQQMNHAPSLVGSAVERSSPFTPQRQMDSSFLVSPNSERNPRPPVPQNTPAHAMYSSSYDATSTPTRQPASTDGPQLVSSRTERLDRPSASPLLYRMESSPLHY